MGCGGCKYESVVKTVSNKLYVENGTYTNTDISGEYILKNTRSFTSLMGSFYYYENSNGWKIVIGGTGLDSSIHILGSKR